MSTESTTAQRPDLDDPALQESDHKAVFAAFIDRTPLDPEVAERVHARAARITEEILRTHGVIDDEIFHSLFDEDDDS